MQMPSSLGFSRLTMQAAPRRRPRPNDFDVVVDPEDACVLPSEARRRRIGEAAPRWKRKRVDDDAADNSGARGSAAAPADVDTITTLMRKRLCVREPADNIDATHGGLFAMLPDELIIELMTFCEPPSLARLACTSARLAGLAADGGLWRRLYKATFPPCTRLGLPCFLDAVDAWHFASDCTATDGLDHGPAADTAICQPRAPRVSGGHDALDDGPARASDGGVCAVGLCRDGHDARKTEQRNGERHAVMRRWWNLRCARLTRMGADRVTGAGTTLAGAGCRHVPPSLVRARGYRWAYALAAMAPLVRKTHHDPDHAHRIIHRGAPDGLAVQCEMCLGCDQPCALTTWRWGRFADCFLSGLGTQVTSIRVSSLDHTVNNRNPVNGDGRANGAFETEATTAIAGLWVHGTPCGTHVRRSADGTIVIGTGAGGARLDAMDEDVPSAQANSAFDVGTDDDEDQGPVMSHDATTARDASLRTPCMIYYPLTSASREAWSYEGGRASGLRQGYGALLSEARATATYEGDWRDDAWHGRGILKTARGSTIFEGRFVRGRPCGRGMLYLHDGMRVEASWHVSSDGIVAPRHIGHVVYANKDRVLCDWGRPTAGTPTEVVVRGFRFADDTPQPHATRAKTMTTVAATTTTVTTATTSKLTATTVQKPSTTPPFAGREVGSEWGPWPTESAAEPTTIDLRTMTGPLPVQSGCDPRFCAWQVTLPVVFWPPMAHPLEPLFARYVDEDRIGWRGYRVRAPRVLGTFDPCAL